MKLVGERLDGYRYRGARSLVLLHKQELMHFVETWKAAVGAGLVLEGFEDPNYETLNSLMVHVLWWARDYMIWTCDKLGLPDPEIREVPEPDAIQTEIDAYLAHLLKRWEEPLAGIPEEPLFFRPQHTTRWGSNLPIESLLEHSVVHPMRHRLQLLELLEGSTHCVDSWL